MLYVESITMDTLKHPLGLEKMPSLTWVLGSDGENVFQRAYRLQISLDRAFETLLYDSGRVESEQSAFVQVENLPLPSCREGFVHVRVWSDTEESPWSETASFLTGMTDGKWDACFVTAETGADWFHSGGSYLRKCFQIDKPVKQAVVCATALGLYHLYINGRETAGDKMLPGWTSYRKHLCYQTWDVTELLKPGENCLGAHLGAGWYKGMMGFIHERCSYGDRTAFLCRLILYFTDGTARVIGTGSDWMGCSSPVTFSEIYDGERYDARLEQPGWNLAGFEPARGESRPLCGETLRDRALNPLTDEEKTAWRIRAREYQPEDLLWRPVTAVEIPFSILSSQPGSRPRVMEELPAARLLTTPKGELVLDFGQNLTGYVRFSVRGREGALCHLRCFETLDAAGNAYFDNLRGAKAEIRYICGDRERHTYEELFSFQGFRYALIQTWPEEVRPENFTACAVYSDMEETGRFSCSAPLVNRLEQNIEWSLRGNFLDIPTDCPQRDERMGWTGDAQIFCRTALYLRNAYTFYRKWLKDVALDQTPEGGVPHIVPNQLEYFTITDWLLGQGTHSASAWADVAVILPWTLYLVYGDRQVLEEQFDSMKKWIDFMRAHAVNDVWNYLLQFGDWVALDAKEGSYYGATPNDLTCTAYYAYSTGLFVKICRVLGRREEAEQYDLLYQRIVKRFRELFLDEKGVMKVRTQTAHILALYFGLIPPEGIPGTVQGLLSLLKEKNGHLVTGFVGTPYFCHVLSGNGCVKEAYDLLLREDFPSWLYQVKKGATTIWEHWDGIKPDGTMWSPAMNSFNHYAYGAIGDWLYRVCAGIDTDECHPGYQTAVVSPQTDPRFAYAAGSLNTVLGVLSSEWKREGETVLLTVRVPVNARARIILEEKAEGPRSSLGFHRNSRGLLEAETGSGTWQVRYHLR